MAEEWFRTAFGEGYREVYAHRDGAAAQAELQAALPRLGLTAGARVLDCGCGWGRHLATLRTAGYDAVGIDLSPGLTRDARASGLPVARADWRALPFGTVFDGVFSLFTSFGYGPTDADDARSVAEMGRVLKPEGRVLIDLPNPPHVRATLVPESRNELDGARIEQSRSLSPDGTRVHKSVAVQLNGIGHRWTESVRLYEPAELERLLGSAGLAIDELTGGFGGGALEDASPRMVVLGHRR